MANSHGIPDTLQELQATCGDLLAPCILSATWPVVPVSSLTLAAFGTYGYAKSGRDLIYIEQPAVSVTLPSAAGTYWLGLSNDTHSAVSGWTRNPSGSHYVFQASASQPTPPDGVVLLSSVTVAGSVITAVSQAGILRAPMSRQDASAVTVTGGTAILSALTVNAASHDALAVTTQGLISTTGVRTFNLTGDNRTAYYSDLQAAGGSNRWFLQHGGDAPSLLGGYLTLAASKALLLGTGSPTPTLGAKAEITFARASISGLAIRGDADSGPGMHVYFFNAAQGPVGSISCTATTTAYTTSSDGRLKDNIAAWLGALDVIRALRPVSFTWKADGSPGVGFLAHEVQAVAPDAVTGAPDAVDEAGHIVPQGLDLAKLVPHLVGAVQALLARVEALEARLVPG